MFDILSNGEAACPKETCKMQMMSVWACCMLWYQLVITVHKVINIYLFNTCVASEQSRTVMHLHVWVAHVHSFTHTHTQPFSTGSETFTTICCAIHVSNWLYWWHSTANCLAQNVFILNSNLSSKHLFTLFNTLTQMSSDGKNVTDITECDSSINTCHTWA